MTDAQTLAVYDAKIEDYLRLTQASPSKSLLAFIKAIPEEMFVTFILVYGMLEQPTNLIIGVDVYYWVW